MAAAGTASPAQRRRSESVRPLSAAQLLSVGSGKVGDVASSVSNGGGVENTAFELGSPLSPAATTPLFPNNNREESVDIPNNNNNNNTVQQAEVPGNSVKQRRESSWLLDRRKDDNEMWRRRKTDPPVDGKYSYHRDYQEALSSLLWQPYDCRGQNGQTLSSGANLDDDADVSVWLYPPPVQRRPKQETETMTYSFRSSNCQSSSSSTSSMSSSSSSAVVATIEDVPPSTVGGLIMSTGSADDSWRCQTSNRNSLRLASSVLVDPKQQQQQQQPQQSDEELVSDLQRSPWLGMPLGALQSRCASSSGECSLCPCQCEEQRSAGCCSLCDAMLVNVQPTTTEEECSLVPSQASVGIVSAATTNNNSVSVVNCYRAVPVIVSAVPAISCSSSVCNVHIVQTTPVDTTTSVVGPARAQRTFTSTEAQTDDIGGEVVSTPVSPSARASNREQRRRERRERRHQRRLNNQNSASGPHHHHDPQWQAQVGERLPDILNSHLPPPYTTLPPMGLHHPPPPPPTVPHPPPPVPVPVSPGSPPPPHHPPPGMRFPFQLTPTGRRRTRGQHYTPEEEPKSCCGVVVTQTVSIRWFIVMIAFVGICCAVVGTVLGAMKASGREHLTVSLLMIGVGIVLITVSGVAWRLTAHDAPSCRMMLGLSSAEESGAEPNRRFVPRLPPSYGRPHHPYAAMMYPEFQYRPPPPSYQASMQEYRLRLLLLDRHSSSPGQAPAGHTVSPPPTYRSHAGSTLSRATLGLRRDPLQSDYSRPPSYRSRTSSTRPTLDPNGNTGCSTAEHSRDPSLSLSESGGGSAVVNVISVMGNGGSEPETLDNIKMIPDQDMPLRMMLNKGGHSGGTVDGAKDGNLVTIVQTDNGSSPVIVTVSGSTMATTTMGGSTSGSGVDPEMEILAHL